MHAFLYFLAFSNSGCNFLNSGERKKVKFLNLHLVLHKSWKFEVACLNGLITKDWFVLKNPSLARVGKIIVRVEKWHQHDFLAVFSRYLQKLRQRVWFWKYHKFRFFQLWKVIFPTLFCKKYFFQFGASFYMHHENFGFLDWTSPKWHDFLYFGIFSSLNVIFATLGKNNVPLRINTFVNIFTENFSSLN